MERAHAQSPDAVLKHFGVTREGGLSEAAVAHARSKYGRNELPAPDKKPLWKLVLEQFEDTLVRILLLAAVISFATALLDSSEDEMQAFVEPVVILLILIANAVVGVVQENNAEAAIEALKEYEADTAKVTRDGRLAVIPAVDLVPGDIIEVAVGDKVPADCRITKIISTTIRVDESALTGESAGKFKQAEAVPNPNASIQEKVSLLFSGTTVTSGKCHAVVIGTGPTTEIGKISKAIQSEDDEKTPLKKKLDEFGDSLSKLIGVICVLVWLININHFNDEAFGGNYVKGAMYYFKIAVALAVAAIPEGLPAVITTCLALGTVKMAKKNAIVRSLPSVETLGATTVICSDKTGTLTTNKMSASKFLVFDTLSSASVYNVQGLSYAPTGKVTREGSGEEVAEPAATNAVIAELARVSTLCNESNIAYNSTSNIYEIVGEPTEGALKVLAEKLQTTSSAVNKSIADATPAGRTDIVAKNALSEYERLAVLEFSRDRKSMSALCRDKKTGKTRMFVKGQPDSILRRCTRVLTASGSVEIKGNDFETIVKKHFAAWGSGELTLRCMALAIVENAKEPTAYDFTKSEKFAEYESPLTFVGLVGMLDPPREEVRASIKTCRQAGIRVIVITGDHKNTAEGICRRIGVFGKDENLQGKSFTGAEYDALSPAEKEDAVRRASLFCQTEPRHKADLVALLQAQKQICAMTGDGVNDAPALKKANIGIAMGSGTAVAKGAAHMVLADDNFATIVSAVEEGRSIFNNTKQFIRYLISSNIGEVVCIFLTVVLGTPEALIPVQLLWVNLVTDGLPATALGFNPPDVDIMQQPPRRSDESIVNGWLFFRYLIIGSYVGAATVYAYLHFFMYSTAGPHITFAQLRNFHDCRELFPEIGCEMFTNELADHAATMALSVLVTIEMFNAFNSLSENQSLLVMRPWINKYLIGAVALSMTLHFTILYVPFLSAMFSITPLSLEDWLAVLAISFPVILLDEIVKFVSRLLVKPVPVPESPKVKTQ